MIAVRFQSHSLRAVAALIVLGLNSAGCDRSARSLALDQPKAREACTKSLEAWKAGKKPADLKPDIIVGDEDWDLGKKLVSFEVLPDETNDGTNLHISVRLAVQDANGKESKPKVVYTVGTSPVVTVIRE